MTSSHTIEILCPCSKTYTVTRKSFRGEIYRDDVSSIANWVYSENIDTDNIHIIIYGSWHRTYPNPYHLTVEIEYNNTSTGKLHISLDETTGFWYKQLINTSFNAMGKRRKRRKTRKRRSKTK